MTILYAPKPSEQPPVVKNKNNPDTKTEKDTKKIQGQQIKIVVYPPKVKYL